MPIIQDFGGSVQDYAAHFAQIVFARPTRCPHCDEAEALIGHGFYWRKAKDQIQVFRIRVKRWLCKACRRTLSVLPSFVLRFRHYLLAVIQAVVVARYEDQASWRETTQRCAQDGLPAPRTIGRWCRSFAEQAPAWWAAVQTTLAQQDSASPALDPLGSASGPQDAPHALLDAATHLLAWAKTRWPEVVSYGLKDRLRFLWHWGFGRGLVRLV
jgi:transposase-like protein